VKWKEVLAFGCGDGMKVVCANNKSVSVALDASGVKVPPARIFLTHSQTHANLTQTPYSSRLTAR